jgi:hypothetical protein
VRKKTKIAMINKHMFLGICKIEVDMEEEAEATEEASLIQLISEG